MAEPALLKWVNTFPIISQIHDISELCDGLVFSRMLEDFDEQYALSDLEKHPSGPTQWLNKKTVLETVFKSLIRYIRNHTNNLEHLTLANIDFNKIAERDDAAETMKFLAIFLVTAAYCPESQRYLNSISKLDKATQEQLGEVIKSTEIEQPKAVKDVDLALEEEHALLKAEHETLKKRHADLYTRNEELQIRNEEFHQFNEDLQKKNRMLEDASHGDQAQYIQVLQSKIEECETLIETQEQQMEDNRITIERQARELAARLSTERLEEINDELRMLKVENASLTKKANTVDHYKRKLETVKITEDDNKKLRESLDVLQSNQTFFDEVISERDQANNTVLEYGKKFEQYENREVDFEAQIRTLRTELRNRDSEVELLKNKAEHDEEFIRDLQEQIRNGDQPPVSPDSPVASSGIMTLEEELNGPDYDSEISRLKSANQTLRATNAGTNNATLRVQLDESERIRKRLEKNLQDLIEQHVVGEENLKAIINTSTDQKDEAIAHTRKLYLEANQELSASKRKIVELQAELSNRDRALHQANADLSAIHSDEIHALEQLKEANEIGTSSLQNDLELLQERHKNLEIDHEQARSHLIEALLAKDNLTKELASSQDEEPKSATSHAEEAGGKAELEALKEQTKKQEGVIQELEGRLKTPEEGGMDAQKAANETRIKNLTRENSLIATAWYDLTSRLQSNHVVLQRRQDAPKSWLNKQRQMVNATPRR